MIGYFSQIGSCSTRKLSMLMDILAAFSFLLRCLSSDDDGCLRCSRFPFRVPIFSVLCSYSVCSPLQARPLVAEGGPRPSDGGGPGHGGPGHAGAAAGDGGRGVGGGVVPGGGAGAHGGPGAVGLDGGGAGPHAPEMMKFQNCPPNYTGNQCECTTCWRRSRMRRRRRCR